MWLLTLASLSRAFASVFCPARVGDNLSQRSRAGVSVHHAPRDTGRGRVAVGQARPDSQVEDCSSGLPDCVPPSAAPSLGHLPSWPGAQG